MKLLWIAGCFAFFAVPLFTLMRTEWLMPALALALVAGFVWTWLFRDHIQG
jgi:hypothetical protein